jgi:hypothetical protein
VVLEPVSVTLKEDKLDFMGEFSIFTIKYPKLLRNYLLYLRTVWKNNKTLEMEKLPYIMKYSKLFIMDLNEKSGATIDDNELVVEIFKLFIYLSFENRITDKGIFLNGCLNLLLSLINHRPDLQAYGVLSQLMNHMVKSMPLDVINAQIKAFQEIDMKKLVQVIPELLGMLQQAQAHAAANQAQAASESKPKLELKMKFGKK